jgi:hypothetical protein
MNRTIANPQENTELDRVLEPLASYICAADHPRSILRSVLTALVQSVEETNRTAAAHFRRLANGGAA